MIQFTKHTIWVLLILALTSCGSKKEHDGEKLPKVKDAVLTNVLDSLSSVEFDYFYSKISTKYKDSSQNVSFKTSVRITKDSAINTLITFARFPVFNAIVTQDSVKITDKQNKCYTVESLSFLKERFGVDFTYHNVEEVLIGLPIGFDKNRKYHRVVNPYEYTLSTHSKRDIKKNEKKSVREIITYYTLNENLKQLKRVVIESPQDTTMIRLDYLTFQEIDGSVLPHNVEVSIESPRNSISVNLEYKKLRINRVEPIYFTIPESYEQCN